MAASLVTRQLTVTRGPRIVLDAVDLEVSRATVNDRAVTIRSTGDQLVLLHPGAPNGAWLRGSELRIVIEYAASPATGLASQHKAQQAALVNDALTIEGN